MSPKNIEEALSVILRTLSNLNIKWIIGGSCALLIHGIVVSPNDIDIIIDPSNYSTALKTMEQYISGDIVTKGYFTKTPFTINEVTGEILSLPLKPEDIEHRVFSGMDLPVNKLTLEYKYYRARTDKLHVNSEKIKMIEAELKARGIDY